MNEQFVEQLFSRLSIVNSPSLQAFLGVPRFIFGFLGLFFLFFIIFSIYKSSWIRYFVLTDAKEFFTFRPFGVRKMTQRWQQNVARLQTANEAEYKLAIIDTDAMLDESLNRLGFRGTTLEDRFAILTPIILPNLEDAKRAHMVRNNIVHDPNFILSLDQAREVLAIYEKSFLDLDLI